MRFGGRSARDLTRVYASARVSATRLKHRASRSIAIYYIITTHYTTALKLIFIEGQ